MLNKRFLTTDVPKIGIALRAAVGSRATIIRLRRADPTSRQIPNAGGGGVLTRRPLFSSLFCRLPPETAQAMGGRGDDRRGEAAQPSPPESSPRHSLQPQQAFFFCFSFLSLHRSFLIFSYLFLIFSYLNLLYSSLIFSFLRNTGVTQASHCDRKASHCDAGRGTARHSFRRNSRCNSSPVVRSADRTSGGRDTGSAAARLGAGPTGTDRRDRFPDDTA